MSGSPVLYKGYAIGYVVVQSSGNLLYAISFSEVLDKYHELKSECSINMASQEEVNFIPDACPNTPLRIDYTDKNTKPSISGLNIGFDFDEWREKDLIESSINWIIDYALTPIQKKHTMLIQITLKKIRLFGMIYLTVLKIIYLIYFCTLQ